MAYQYLMWPEYVEQNREGLGGGTWCRHISLGGFSPEREILLRKEGENSFVCCFKLLSFSQKNSSLCSSYQRPPVHVWLCSFSPYMLPAWWKCGCICNYDPSYFNYVLNSEIFVLWDRHHKLSQPVNDFRDRNLHSAHSTAFISTSHIEYVARETPFTHDELTSEARSNSA